MWTLHELHYTPKRYHFNGIGSITSYCSREDLVGTCRPDLRNREISESQA